MRDVRRGLGKERRVFRDLIRLFNLGVRGERADPEDAGAQVDAAQILQAGDVDQELGRRKPHVERCNQALPARQDPGPGPLDQLERFGERFRFRIGERRRFQVAPPRRRLCMIWTTLFPRFSGEGTL